LEPLSSSYNNDYDDILKQNNDLKEKIKDLEGKLAAKLDFLQKTRIEALKDIQFLRDKVIYVSSEVHEDEVKRKMVNINVSNFDPFDGLDSNVAALIKQRLSDIKHEAEL
jgi:cell division septum initiation protein DivIVA